MAPKQNHGKRDMNKGGVMFDTPIPTGNDSHKFVKPSECPFNISSPFVTTQRTVTFPFLKRSEGRDYAAKVNLDYFRYSRKIPA